MYEPEYGHPAAPVKIGQRAAATGGGVWERVGPESTSGGAWEMVDYNQYQQHSVILPTVMPRRGSRRETALHPMVLNYTSPIGESLTPFSRARLTSAQIWLKDGTRLIITRDLRIIDFFWIFSFWSHR